MSNSLAIAVATRGLTAKISEALTRSGLGAQVSAVRPTSLTATQAGVNAFLYHVTSNAALRNVDLPTRRSSGELSTRPQLALDLHYILTFTGDEAELMPQRILGVVLPAIYAQGSLTPDEIDRLIQLQSPGFMDGADLAQQGELVRFSLGTMSLEELSKLWSVFFQTQYLLSVPVQASVLLLEAPLTPSPSQLVRQRAVYSGLPEPPRLEGISPPFAAVPTLGAPAELTLSGSGLLGDESPSTEAASTPEQRTLVRFGKLAAQSPLAVDVDKVVVALPKKLRAGVHAVSVSVRKNFEQAGELKSFELDSNTLAFAFLPSIESTSPLTVAGGVLRLDAAPAVARTQAVHVILERREPSLQRLSVAWTAPVAAPGEEIQQDIVSLEVTLPPDLSPGRYFVRLEVDGVGSSSDDPNATPFLDVPHA